MCTAFAAIAQGGARMKLNRKSMAAIAMVFLLFTAGFVLLTACGSSVYEATAESGRPSSSDSLPDKEETTESSSEKKASKAENTSVFVYVCGAVKRPGVYELPAGSRVVDAVRSAGGLAAEADSTRINQAELLTDGQQITVLTKAETADLPAQGSASAGKNAVNGGQPENTAKVNINTAAKEELMTLKGIGESRAEDIIAYRETNGAFDRIEDIMKVSGIKTSLFNKIKDRITV